MPEGPETTLMTERVKNMLRGKIITNLETVNGKVKGSGLQQAQLSLPMSITKVCNNGKLMWFELETKLYEKWWLFVTFGLTGGWCRNSSCQHNRLKIVCTDGTELYYRDKTNYGSMTFTNDAKVAFNKQNDRGFNLFGEEQLTSKHLIDIINTLKKDMNICVFLMEQRYLSGIGNYLKSEIIYSAKLSPWSNIKKFTSSEVNRLYHSIIYVCNRAYLANGRTSNYSDLFSSDECTFEMQMMVYNKNMDILGNNIICDQTPDKRKTYWVKDVQE